MSKQKIKAIHDSPGYLLSKCARLLAAGKGEIALGLMQQALAARPGDPLIEQLAEMILARSLPDFHDGMLRDSRRNAAYRRAIEAMVPGRSVLDIGTGSGLLAMMAACGGAAHVYACEANPMLAATARRIIAANGLEQQITVLPVHSNKLDPARDLAGGVDLVVSEIFSHELIGEHVLASLADARARLCRPGAVFLPGRAAIRVALAEVRVPETPIGEVEGFDLSLFARHLRRRFSLPSDSQNLALRSESANLFAFDFSEDASDVDTAELRLVSDGGRIGGVVQWISFELAPGIAYENEPGSGEYSHWGVVFHPLATPRDTAPGETVTVHGWHDASRLAVWVEA